MKDATYFAEIACREMTQYEQVRFRPLIYNLFLHCQADAFVHAGLMADEQMLQDSVGKQLRQYAQVIWPGFQEIKPPRETLAEQLEKVIKSDQSYFDQQPPPAA